MDWLEKFYVTAYGPIVEISSIVSTSFFIA